MRFSRKVRFSRALCMAAVGAIPVLAAVTLGAQNADEWPNWRGPRGNGSQAPGEFPVQWSADKVLWKVQLPGKGTSTPIVWKEKIYLTSPSDGEDAVLAFDLEGRQLWRRELGSASAPRHRRLGSSSNASPITDGNGLFVYFRSGNLAALEFDSSVRWQINLVDRFGPDELFWDQGTSPVVTDKHVVMARMHGGESWLAAFDKATGEMAWQQPRNYETPRENDNAYTTPVLLEHEGRSIFLVWGADHLTAHDAATGQLLWSCGGFNPRGTGFWPAIATPVVVDDIVVVPVGRDDRDRQASVHGIRLGGSGDVTATHRVWQRDDVGVFVASPAVYQGRVYLLRDRGEIVCLDPKTGRTIWSDAFPRTRSSYYSSPIIAGGILYAAREDGIVFSARLAEDGMKLLGENEMGERIIASPVPVHDRVLLRGDDHLFCVAGG